MFCSALICFAIFCSVILCLLFSTQLYFNSRGLLLHDQRKVNNEHHIHKVHNEHHMLDFNQLDFTIDLPAK